jgi:hypothetical protein
MTVRLPDGSQMGPPGTIISDSEAARRPDDAPALELSGLISDQVLDLAGGWRNAWRTEMRGPHGEWIKGMGDTSFRPSAITRSFLSNSIARAGREDAPDEADALSAALDAYGKGDIDGALSRMADAMVVNRLADDGGGTRVAGYTAIIKRLKKEQPAPPRSLPGTPNGGLTKDDVSDKILLAYRQESDTKAKSYLNIASADWDAEDYKGAADTIRLAAAQKMLHRDYAAGSMYNKLADFIDTNWGPNGTIEANRSAMQAFLNKEAPKVPFLVGGGKEIWSGQIHTFPNTGTRLLGDLDWNGNMRVREDVAAGINEAMSHPGAPISRPQDFTVPLHELIHGVVPEDQPDRSGDMAAYQHPAEADIEEGFTELGTTQHMDQYMQQIGISTRPASTRDVGGGDLMIPAGDLAQQVNNPKTISEGEGWGHYPQETSAALDWVQNVAEADGRPNDYAYMTRLTDEINQQGTAGKSLTMARQIMRTEVKGADARLTADDRSQAQILNQTRQAIIDNWKVGGSIVAAATSARQEARQSAHQIAQEKLMGERSAA